MKTLSNEKTLLKEKTLWMKTFNGKYTTDEYTLMGLDIFEGEKSTITKKKCNYSLCLAAREAF